ncbi:MAG: NB-ARC domain-containing protein [Scytonema sp. PMC 1069.18]|nr:NB-ARC domain-containing protein [Scytonema sp. PMC 1069.18]MEC4883600.1 NB-ARC domain-containing protein [Scytonema sp. PMC 1070.18]
MNAQTRRNRGVILTIEGWQKFQQAKTDEECREKFGYKYTLEEISNRAGLTPNTVAKVLDRQEAVDKKTLFHLFKAFHLDLNVCDYSKPGSDWIKFQHSNNPKHVDWGEAVDISVFYGRTAELTQLQSWLITERCRIVALLGMGGIGKTSLATKLARQVQKQFEYVIWRSLYNAPPLSDFLANLIHFFSDSQISATDLPTNLDLRILRLFDYLRDKRCLIVLDNVETIMKSGTISGRYQEGYEDYGLFIKRLGETPHQSSLILTSWEKPKEVASLEGETLPVRSLRLKGLEAVEGQKIFAVKGIRGSESVLRDIVERYAGNALALKIVATTIQDVFDGNLYEFLKQDTVVFGDIRYLLDQQFLRLSNLEREVMYWLAINREPISLSDLQEDIIPRISPQKLLEALESLTRRSLIEKSAALFALQPVVLEYLTNQFVEQVSQELITQNLYLFKNFALIKAQAKDYIREAQVRCILKPVINGLLISLKSQQAIEEKLTQILARLRETSQREPEYSAGNIINLFCQMGIDIRGYDFSYLTIWQADLRRRPLQDVNFFRADLAKSVFAETFAGICSLAFNPDGTLLAIGDSSGEIQLRQVSDGKQLLSLKQHTNWVTSVVFSPDGYTLASASSDHTVKLWDVSTGQCFQTFYGHEHEVWSVAFSPDGDTLASGSNDRTVRLWCVSSGKCKGILQGHTNWVVSVAFCLDGNMLISGSNDNTIRLWDVSTGECKTVFHGHDNGVRAIALNSQGTMIASGSDDNTIRLWDVSTGECKRILRGHSNSVWSVAFSPQGDTLASGSHDQTVRFWDVSTGKCIKIHKGHSNWILSVAFSPQGNTLASGSRDQTVKLWSVSSGKCLRAFQGYTNSVLSVTFSLDGRKLASGSHDQTVKLWDVSTGQVLKTLQGHTSSVYSLAFSPKGNTLVSGSGDKTLKLWDVSTGQIVKTLRGHRGSVWSVAFSPDGKTVVSSSEDQTIKLWDVSSGQVLKTFQGHDAGVCSVAFNSQGTMLASGATEQTLKLWDVSNGRCLRTFEGHTSWIWSVAFSPDGNILASTSPDRTLRLWSVNTGECLKLLQVNTSWLQLVMFSADNQIIATSMQDYTINLWDASTLECLITLHGHTGWIWSISFSSDNQTLATSSEDETIRLWDVKTGDCLKIYKIEKPYERMNIKEVIGLTEATTTTLQALGAVY